MIELEETLAELIPGLTEDMSLLCLLRLHHSSQGISSQVCRRWRNLIKSKDFYHQRRSNGLTRKAACLVQLLQAQTEPNGSTKPSPQQPTYGLSVFDPLIGSMTRLDPIPKYPDGLPLFCHAASTEGKLLVLGGWDPLTCKPVRDVFLYDFTEMRWKQRADMPLTASFFAAGASGGRVYVAGGHDESKNALKSSWVYDVERDEWSDLGQTSEERDECEGLIVGSEFWVISGYGTDTPGMFKTSADVYDIGSGAWRRVEEVWPAGSKSPRGCVGWVQGKGLVRWDEFDPMVQVGTCGLEMGNRVVITGPGYQGGPHGFFTAGKNSESVGEYGKLAKIEDISEEECSGIVQSMCCVEI